MIVDITQLQPIYSAFALQQPFEAKPKANAPSPQCPIRGRGIEKSLRRSPKEALFRVLLRPALLCTKERGGFSPSLESIDLNAGNIQVKEKARC
jgi:hypothetical protein